MKSLVLTLLFAAASASAQVYVQPHVRSDGTYVPGHYRSAPDGLTINNYGTQGNYNPYTGQSGTRPAIPPLPSYQPSFPSLNLGNAGNPGGSIYAPPCYPTLWNSCR